MNIVATVIAFVVLAFTLGTVAVTVFDVRLFAHHPAHVHATRHRHST